MTIFFPFCLYFQYCFLNHAYNRGDFHVFCNSYLAVLLAFRYYVSLDKNKKTQFAAFVFNCVCHFLLGDKVTIPNVIPVNFYLL